MPKKLMSPGLCTAFVVAAGCLWGTTGLFIRHFNAIGLRAMNIAELRSIVTAVIMVLTTLCIKPGRLRVRLRDAWCFLGTGLVSVLFFNFCYFETIQTSSMAVAATLLYTAPVFVMLFSLWLFGERLTVRKTAALVLAVTGCVLVSGILTGGGRLTGRGVLLGIGAGLGYGLYSIFTRYALQRGYHSMTITAYTFIFAAVGGVVFFRPTAFQAAYAADGGRLIWLLLAYALVTTVLPYLLYTGGLTGMENSKASVIASVEPVTAALLGLAVFREVPDIPAVGGMLLVLAAVILLNTGGRKVKE